MKLLAWVYYHKQGIEIMILNVFGASIIGWLKSLMNNWTAIVAGIVAISVIVMNGMKIYGLHLDNQRKRRELRKDLRNPRKR